ncbi:hypothetical protein [Luteimonas mephitis]|uniref:hypothetical protein n=1 Tax=Luteimonas mephitis TaxID=83615 RepID=UPI003A8CA9B9
MSDPQTKTPPPGGDGARATAKTNSNESLRAQSPAAAAANPRTECSGWSSWYPGPASHWRRARPLGTLEEETERLRALLLKPSPRHYLARWYSLNAQRWFAFERALVAAHNENRSPEAVAELMMQAVVESWATDKPFDFSVASASWLLDGVYANCNCERCQRYRGRVN